MEKVNQEQRLQRATDLLSALTYFQMNHGTRATAYQGRFVDFLRSHGVYGYSHVRTILVKENGIVLRDGKKRAYWCESFKFNMDFALGVIDLAKQKMNEGAERKMERKNQSKQLEATSGRVQELESAIDIIFREMVVTRLKGGELPEIIEKALEQEGFKQEYHRYVEQISI